MQPIWFGKFKAILFVEPWFSEFLSCLLCYASPLCFQLRIFLSPLLFLLHSPCPAPLSLLSLWSFHELHRSLWLQALSSPAHPLLGGIHVYICVWFFVCFFIEHLRISDCHLPFTFLTPDLCYAKELKLLFKEWFKDYATMAVPWAPTMYLRKPSTAPVPSFGEDGFSFDEERLWWEGSSLLS